ncbi:Smr/MutS family protein [Sphingomonas gellani]|nr:Smr/MutS family protein [Sphingomonas gellani]
MTSRLLSPEEAQLWGRVMASVRPLRAAAPLPIGPAPTFQRKVRLDAPAPAPVAPKPLQKVRTAPGETLDGGWDKRLTRGTVQPDMTLDLHGHTLASAHALLDTGIDRAIRGGCRVILLVTGRPPRPESERPHARGAIRAAVADWLGASRHADRIAAIRGAHPRHGGQGALYIILRRARG